MNAAVDHYLDIRRQLPLPGHGAAWVDELRDHCREHLAAYKVPKLVEFRDELPKTPVGKILRRALRDEPGA